MGAGESKGRRRAVKVSGRGGYGSGGGGGLGVSGGGGGGVGGGGGSGVGGGGRRTLRGGDDARSDAYRFLENLPGDSPVVEDLKRLQEKSNSSLKVFEERWGGVESYCASSTTSISFDSEAFESNGKLPEELLCFLFSKIDRMSYFSLSCVCKTYYRILNTLDAVTPLYLTHVSVPHSDRLQWTREFQLMAYRASLIHLHRPLNFEFLILGLPGHGKTEFLHSICPKPSSSATRFDGAQWRNKTIVLPHPHTGVPYVIQVKLFDPQSAYGTVIAPQERFYLERDGVFLLYDVTEEDSSSVSMAYFSEISNYVRNEVQIMVVGTNMDRVEEGRRGREGGEGSGGGVSGGGGSGGGRRRASRFPSLPCLNPYPSARLSSVSSCSSPSLLPSLSPPSSDFTPSASDSVASSTTENGMGERVEGGGVGVGVGAEGGRAVHGVGGGGSLYDDINGLGGFSPRVVPREVKWNQPYIEYYLSKYFASYDSMVIAGVDEVSSVSGLNIDRVLTRMVYSCWVERLARRDRRMKKKRAKAQVPLNSEEKEELEGGEDTEEKKEEEKEEEEEEEEDGDEDRPGGNMRPRRLWEEDPPSGRIVF